MIIEIYVYEDGVKTDVTRKIDLNPNTTKADVETLLEAALRNNHTNILGIIVKHKRVTAVMLQKIMETEGLHSFIYEGVAESAKINIETQKLIINSNNTDEQYFHKLVSNRKIDFSLLESLTNHSDEKVLAAIVQNPISTPEMVQKIFERYMSETKLLDSKNTNLFYSLSNELAESIKITPKMIERMFNHAFKYSLHDRISHMIIVRLIQNLNTPSYLLRKVSDSAQFNKMSIFLASSNCDDDVFDKLLEYGEDRIHVYMLTCENTPTWVLRKILYMYGENNIEKHEIDEIRLFLKHKNVTNEMVKEIYAQHKRKQTQTAAMKTMYERGLFHKDWPVEWVEAHYGIKLPKGLKPLGT